MVPERVFQSWFRVLGGIQGGFVGLHCFGISLVWYIKGSPSLLFSLVESRRIFCRILLRVLPVVLFRGNNSQE